MTAEVAVLNRSAVALAADSAVTVQMRTGDVKIYNSINKLFRLSRCRPVGIMIYGNAQFMEIPWETIIKMYRDQLDNDNFDSLIEYGNDFIKYLKKNKKLFNSVKQNDYVETRVYQLFYLIKEYFLEAIRKEIKKNNSITKIDIEVVFTETIDAVNKKINSASKLKNMKSLRAGKIVKKYKRIFENALQRIYQKYPITDLNKRKLFNLAAESFLRELDEFESSSGIVIAGFGKKQEYPAVVNYSIDGIVSDTLRYNEENHAEISLKHNALICPFAQREESDAFLRGIHPGYAFEIMGYIKT